MIDDQGQRGVEPPRLIDPGTPCVGVRERVQPRHGPAGEDVPAQPEMPERARIVEQGVPPADQDEQQHQHEDQRRPDRG